MLTAWELWVCATKTWVTGTSLRAIVTTVASTGGFSVGLLSLLLHAAARATRVEKQSQATTCTRVHATLRGGISNSSSESLHAVVLSRASSSDFYSTACN